MNPYILRDLIAYQQLSKKHMEMLIDLYIKDTNYYSYRMIATLMHRHVVPEDLLEKFILLLKDVGVFYAIIYNQRLSSGLIDIAIDAIVTGRFGFSIQPTLASFLREHHKLNNEQLLRIQE